MSRAVKEYERLSYGGIGEGHRRASEFRLKVQTNLNLLVRPFPLPNLEIVICEGWAAKSLNQCGVHLVEIRFAVKIGVALIEFGRVARTLSYAEGAPSSGFEGGSCVWVLSSRSPNPSEAILAHP